MISSTYALRSSKQTKNLKAQFAEPGRKVAVSKRTGRTSLAATPSTRTSTNAKTNTNSRSVTTGKVSDFLSPTLFKQFNSLGTLSPIREGIYRGRTSQRKLSKRLKRETHSRVPSKPETPQQPVEFQVWSDPLDVAQNGTTGKSALVQNQTQIIEEERLPPRPALSCITAVGQENTVYPPPSKITRTLGSRHYRATSVKLFNTPMGFLKPCASNSPVIGTIEMIQGDATNPKTLFHFDHKSPSTPRYLPQHMHASRLAGTGNKRSLWDNHLGQRPENQNATLPPPLPKVTGNGGVYNLRPR